jgi:hypothetical protein
VHVKLLRSVRIRGREVACLAVVDLTPPEAEELVRSGKAEHVAGRASGDPGDPAAAARRQYRKERKAERAKGKPANADGGGPTS